MSTDAQNVAALQARLNELEAENARLAATAESVPPGSAKVARKQRWRPLVSAICIVLASILVPLSIVGAWSRTILIDTDQFVATMGPVIDDPAVQNVIIDRTTAAINENLDIEQVTDDLFDGIQELGLPPRASAALDLLRVPATQGVQSLIDQTVTRLVESEAFAEIWDRALRASHRAAIAAVSGGGSGGVVTIDETGVIGIELGPIIAEVKQRLVDRGLGLAAGIPEVERTIVVGQAEGLATARVYYAAAVTIGWWLPVIALALFIAGILIARRRTTALLGSGIGLAVGSAILATTLGVVPLVLGVAATNAELSGGALQAIYDHVSEDMRQTAIIGVLLGIIVAVLAWLQGRWRGAVAVRRSSSALNATIRSALAARGFRTGAFGSWMDRQRVFVRVVICVLAVVWLWMLRPLSGGEIALVLVVALLVWWVCELLRPPAVIPEDDAVAPDEPALQVVS